MWRGGGTGTRGGWLKEANDGRIAIALKKPRRGGETHAFLTPLQLIRRISSLIPPAGMNLIRYFGILAPAAKHRGKVVPVPRSSSICPRIVP